MAKMFYSLEEAAARLKKTTDQVREMASRGEVTEFRDGQRLIFKVDQINLLAGEEEEPGGMSSMIPLADTGAGASASGIDIGLEDSGPGASGSGSGSAVLGEEAKERSGIPVFDVDQLEEADPSAVTQVTDSGVDGGLSLESLGSGSGLMDLTKESDDTSLGAEGLLDELYPGGEEGAGATAGETAGGGLFEGAPAGGDLGGPSAAELAALAPMAEAYDGPGSGLAGGLSLGAVLALAMGLAVVLMSMAGLAPGGFMKIGGENAPLIWTAIFLVIVLVGGGVGFVMGKKSAA